MRRDKGHGGGGDGTLGEEQRDRKDRAPTLVRTSHSLTVWSYEALKKRFESVGGAQPPRT